MPENVVKKAIVCPWQVADFDPANPYKVCVACVYKETNRCNGPDYSRLSGEQRCAMYQARLEYLRKKEPGKWTYKFLTDETFLSESTVIRLITDPDYDPKVSTFAIFNRVLMGGSEGWFPCAMMNLADPEVIEVQSPELLKEIAIKDARISKLEQRVETTKEEAQAKIDYLKAQVESYAEQNRDLNKMIHKLMEKL